MNKKSKPSDLANMLSQKAEAKLKRATTDIPQSIQAEQKPVVASSEWQTTFDLLSEAVCLLDNSHHVIYYNKAMADLFPQYGVAMIGKPCWEIVHGTKELYSECPVVRMRTTMRRESSELKINARWYKITVDPFFDADKKLAGEIHIISDIDARKQQDDALKASFALLKIAGETAKFGGWSIDLTDTKVTWSDEVAHIHELPAGYSPSLEEGLKYYSPEFRDKIRDLVNNCIINGVSFDEELQIITVRNSCRWVRTTGVALKDEKGEIYKIQGSFQDISEHKHVEETLKQSEEKYKYLVKKSSDVIWTQDLNFQTTYMSDNVEQFLGYTVSEYLAIPVNKRLPAESVEIASKVLTENLRKIRNGEANVATHTFLFEMLHRHKNGSLLWGEVNCSFLHDSNNNITGIHGITRDISSRKEAENALIESEERYRKLVELSPLGIGIYQDGKFVFSNPASLSIMGCENQEELIGKPIMSFVHPESRAVVIERMGQVAKGMAIKPLEEKLMRLDGSIFTAEVVACNTVFNGEPAGQLLVQDISLRKQSEIKLKESESKYRNLVNEVNDGFYTADENDVLTFANRALAHILGFNSGKDLTGHHFMEFISPAAIPELTSQFAAATQEGIKLEFFNTEIIRPDGSIRYIEIKPKEILEEGLPKGSLGLIRDITEQKLAEKSLLQKEELYHGMFEKTQAINLLVDPTNGAIVDANAAATEFYGYAPEQLKMMKISDLSTSPKEEIFTAMMETKSEELKYFNVQHRLADGSVRDVEVYSNTVEIAGVTFLHSIIHDITDRKRAQEAVRFQSEIVDHMAEGIILVGISDGIIRYTNPTYERMFGYNPGEMFGQSFKTINFKDDNSPVNLLNEINATIKEHGNWIGEHINVKKDGTPLWCKSYLSVFDHPEYGGIWVAVTEDISKRKNAELQIKKLNDDLELRVEERTAKLQQAVKDLESFSYSASHEIRTPLRALNGYASILLEDHSHTLNDDGKRMLNVIVDSANKMGQLIDDLLLFSHYKPKEIQFSEIDMNSMVTSVYAELVSEAEKEKIDFRMCPIPEGYGNPAMIRQVWKNLIGNAIKFSSRKNAPAIDIGSVTEGGETIYYVKDNGTGFDMEHEGMLFGIFKRLPNAKGFDGSGVGLSIVKRIILSCNGRVWAEGKPGEGATFYFTLGK